MKKAYLFLVKNWKTSIVGLLTTILTYLLTIGKITQGQFELGVGVLVSIGYLLAKDGDSTLSTDEKEMMLNSMTARIDQKFEEETEQLFQINQKITKINNLKKQA